MQRRAIAAYLGLAIGDALGATVEFMTPREIKAKFGIHQTLCGGGWLHLKPGQVTDDTTMSFALGRAILATGNIEAFDAATAFDAWMRAKPVDIGNTVRRNLLNFRRTGDPQAPYSEHDAGNGAAMRILPVALATLGLGQDQVRLLNQQQAHITHHNNLSDAACECLIFMLQAALRGANKIELLHLYAHPLAQQYPVFRFRSTPQKHNPSGYIVDTMIAVFQALFDTDDFRSCLIDVVNRGGDADTTGAIAGMLAGALYGLEQIPTEWLKTLDPQVKAECERQALGLWAKIV